jgi:hypothetical protein
MIKKRAGVRRFADGAEWWGHESRAERRRFRAFQPA